MDTAVVERAEQLLAAVIVVAEDDVALAIEAALQHASDVVDLARRCTKRFQLQVQSATEPERAGRTRSVASR